MMHSRDPRLRSMAEEARAALVARAPDLFGPTPAPLKMKAVTVAADPCQAAPESARGGRDVSVGTKVQCFRWDFNNRELVVGVDVYRNESAGSREARLIVVRSRHIGVLRNVVRALGETLSGSYGSSIAMHPRCDVRCNIRSRRNSDLFDSLDAVKRRLKEVIGLPEPVFVERPIREPTKARIAQTLDAAPAPAAVSATFTVVVNNAPWELVQALLAQNATLQPPSADGRTLTLTF